MPVAINTDQSQQLTTLTASGEITLADIMLAVEGFKDSPPAKNILWDFSCARPGDRFNSTDMDKIAAKAMENLGRRKEKDGKTAFVATTDSVFGIARMYTSHLEMHGISHQLKVFRTLDEARRWLDGHAS